MAHSPSRIKAHRHVVTYMMRVRPSTCLVGTGSSLARIMSVPHFLSLLPSHPVIHLSRPSFLCHSPPSFTAWQVQRPRPTQHIRYYSSGHSVRTSRNASLASARLSHHIGSPTRHRCRASRPRLSPRYPPTSYVLMYAPRGCRPSVAGEDKHSLAPTPIRLAEQGNKCEHVRDKATLHRSANARHGPFVAFASTPSAHAPTSGNGASIRASCPRVMSVIALPDRWFRR